MSLTSMRRMLATVGVVFIVLTWIFLVFARPTEWETVTGSAAGFTTLVGYFFGAACLLVATLPGLPARTIAVIPIALVLNIVIGQIVGSVGIPLYLDSVGTVLVAALAGPTAGVTTGVLSSVVWGLFNPAALPFAAVSGFVGASAGYVSKNGWFKRPVPVILSGVVVGIVSGLLAAPIAAFVYGGTAGVGTGALVALFRAMGNSLLGSVTLQSVVSDPLDKALVFLLVYLVLKALPKKTLASLTPKER